MAKKPLSDEVKALHKKFWPANIVICVVALVAGFCMLFMPWIDIRINISGEKVSELIAEMTEDNNGGTTPQSAAPGGGSSSNIDEITTEVIMDALEEALKEESFSIPINLYPLKMLSAATGGEEEVGEFFNSAIGKNGVQEFASDFVKQVSKPIMNAVLDVMIDDTFKTLEVEGVLSAEDAAKVEKYKDDAKEVVSLLIDGDVDQAEAKVGELVNKISEEFDLGEVDPDIIHEAFQVIKDNGTIDGEFDLMNIIQNMDKLIEDMENMEGGSNDGVSGQSASSYVVSTQDAGSGNSSNSGEDNPLQSVLDILEDPAAAVIGEMDAETLEMIQLVLLIIFLVFVAFPTLLWFLLAIFSFIRIFTVKKKVKMWYVKFFCLWAGLFLVIFNILLGVLPGMINDPEITGILEAFSITMLGSGVVTGVCWLVLILGSIFYYNRIKKKIKKQIKLEKSGVVAPAESAE